MDADSVCPCIEEGQPVRGARALLAWPGVCDEEWIEVYLFLRDQVGWERAARTTITACPSDVRYWDMPRSVYDVLCRIENTA